MTEMKQENARLRQENLLLHLMSQDVFEKVTEKLEMQRSGLRQEFDDKFNFDGFRQAYHEYIQEHHQYDTHPDFNEGDWEYFWLNHDELVHRERCAITDWGSIFEEQSDRCRQCGGIMGCSCGGDWRWGADAPVTYL